MKFGVLCFALVGLVFLTSEKIMAQDDPLAPQAKSVPFYIGPVAGVNIVSHSTELKTVNELDGQALCPTLTKGSSVGYYVGISGEYFIGGAANSESSIIAKIVYNTMPSSFEKRGDSYPSLVNDKTVFTAVDFKAEAIVNMLTLEALYKLNFMGRFGATAGFNIDYIMKAEENTKMQLVTDDPNVRFNPVENQVYEDNYRTLVLSKGEIAGKQSLRIALKVGLQYEIDGGKGIVIVPNINYNLGLTNITTEKDWTVSALQIGVDVRFALGGN